MAKFTRSLVIGPGNANLWGVDKSFDDKGAVLTGILHEYGIPTVDAVSWYTGMPRRDNWHFSHDIENKLKMARLAMRAVHVLWAMDVWRMLLRMPGGAGGNLTLPTSHIQYTPPEDPTNRPLQKATPAGQ